MNSDALLDYAVFQLSPKRSRCELFVSADGSMEKIASGLLKPFVPHLQIAEEQVASASQSIPLKVGGYKNAETWFTKGTLDRFVRFVSTPEVLEQVNTFDAEMSQLEADRRIYLQGAGDRLSGGGVPRVTAGDDATKKELLRAIDVRLAAVQQDLSTACARAAAAGFNIDTVSQLQMFADKFGAHRLNEACAQFISLNERRPELIQTWKSGLNNQAVRSSFGSDMSIDDDPPSPPPCLRPGRCQQPDPKGPTLSRESSVEREAGKKLTDSITGQDSSKHDQSGSIQSGQPARRLSVQDRINMFENKQKENSGGKPVELRRVSSDLLSGGVAEKAVLRRWSGASDMSIDLSVDKKDTESPLCTPVSAVVSEDKNVSNSNDSTTDISSVAKLEINIIFSSDRGSDNILKRVSLSNPEQSLEARKSNPNLDSGGSDVLKDQVGEVTQSRSSVGMLDGRECPEDSFITSAAGKEGLDGFGNQGKLKGPRLGEETWMSGVKNPVSFPTQIKFFVGKGGEQIETSNRREGSESRDGSVNEIRVKATQKTAMESGVTEGGPGSRIAEAFASRYKGIIGDPSSSMKEVISIGEPDIAEKIESRMSEKLSGKTVSSFEDCGPQRLKFDRQGLTDEPNNKAQVQRDKICSSGSIGTQFSGQVDAHEVVDYFSTPPSEQAQKIRPSKGKHELNNELKLKASELEKLFAEHKLRVPGEQSNTARKGRSGDTQCEAASSLHYTKPVADTALDNYQSSEPSRFSKNSTKFDASSPMKAIDGDAINKKFSDLSVSKGSRGKLYDSYMQIRDAKLREDWSAKREEKEARLKSLQDSLERNRSEMKAKISGSADRQDSVSSADRRAERIRSYNRRSIMKLEQQQLNFGDSEDDDEALGFPEPNRFHESKASDDISTRDGVSRGAHLKKKLPNNRKFSSTPRTSAAPVPKPATKVSAISSGKRRTLPVNPLAQSVPNLSDMRNENTKPSSGANKPTRSQVRSFARRQSTSDEAAIVRDDKSHRSQSLRKSSANPGDFRETSPMDSDGAYLTPIKSDKEILENAVSKPFLKKGSRTSFVSQTSSARERASGVPELISNEVVNCDMDCGPDKFFSAVNDEDEEELESLNNEDQNVFNNGEPKQMLEQDELVNSGSENGDGTLTFSLVDQALGSTLPVKSLPDWSGGSPVSWNSHTQHPFSYAHEMSDVDASVDSPVGSPASWNSHSLKQVETDSARMRKTWGMAQKSMMAVHSSNNQSRKDMTRGFKRLLKFGRKSRGSESVVDWISAATSEGDDTEDGKEPAHRLSDDLRKSRMRFSHAQASEDSFDESEFFNESVESSLQSSIPAPPANFKLREDHMSGSSIKAPRSFFSLSSFRSKGSSDSKLR